MAVFDWYAEKDVHSLNVKHSDLTVGQFQIGSNQQIKPLFVSEMVMFKVCLKFLSLHLKLC